MSPAKLPYVICHMVCSVDGRTLTKNWNMDSANIFETSAATIESEGWIVGRATMQEFASKKTRQRGKGRFNVPKGDFVAPHIQKTYAVAIDPFGKCNWEVNHVDSEHVIEVLTEKVTTEYLDHLRSRQVSYIFGGKTSLNLKRVLEKLHRLFGIKRITLQGGGTNNGSFLNAGLIDEISVIVMPVADGTKGMQSVFDIEPRTRSGKPAKLKLISAKPFKSGCVWLKYKVA